MRPNKLIMSAFGPYSEKVEIELNKLGNNGLYLITGDTGAGKTTIFDAITFALFGEASGNSREAYMFRSKYARPEMPTEVELYFTYADKQYYIKRNPEYDRPKSRGEGITTEKANAQLHLPNGKIITKVKEVNSAITEILGVDKNQFTQIAMIAQGDFLKLLLASTDERKKIFQKLFKTQNYFMLQEKLKVESGKLSREYENLKNSISQYINGITVDDESIYFGDVIKAKSNEISFEETVNLIKKLISDDENSILIVTDQKEKLQKELDEIKSRIIKAEDVLMAKSDFEKNEFDFRIESEKENELKKEFEQGKRKLSEAKELYEQSAKIEAVLSDYDELSKMQNKLNSNKVFIDKSNESLCDFEVKIKFVEEEIVKLSDELKTLEKTCEEKINLQNEKEKIENEKEKIKNLCNVIDDIEKLRERFLKLYNSYKEKNINTDQLELELKEKTKIYLEAQAGILGETLETDKPCPVCGSINHPKIAVKPEFVPSKEELDTLNECVNKANAELSDLRSKAGNAKGILTEKEESANKEITSLLGEYSIEDAKNVITVRVSCLDSSIGVLSEKLSEIQAKIKRREEISDIFPRKNEELQATKENYAELISDIKIKLNENVSLKKRVSELKTKLTYDSKDDAQNQINFLNLKAKKIENEYEIILKAVNDSREKLVSLKSAREEILKRMSGENGIDAEKEANNKLVVEDRLKELDYKAKILHSRFTSNKMSLDNILAKFSEIKSIEEKWMWMKALSNTANGNISGREKIMLETYIQMTYFDRIINRANTRLMVMSGGQYELKRRVEAENNRSQTGLELDVIDHYNGTLRSVKTLSGGESFKASLSLALGLSDEIQSSAGGVKLDTMFVDEGFGSLDEDSLIQAINALSTLADGNRLVGIISHVSELKDRISTQICVKKDKFSGSSVELVY